MAREGGKNHLFQLSETQTYHCRIFGYQKQAIFFNQAKEAIYEEISQNHLGFRK